LDDQTSRFSLLEHSQVELGNTKAQLEARIGELETQLAGLSSEKASLEARLGEHDLNVQGLNARINVLTDERDAALLRIEALQSSVNATAGDVEALREEVTSIAAERDTALAQLKALEADVSARASEVSVLNDDMLALRDQLAAVMSERDSAHAQVKSLEAEIDLDKLGELNGQINQLQNRLASLTAEREERLSVIRALESDLATTRAQLAAANVPPEPADTLAEDSDIGAMSLVSGNLTKSSAAKSAGDKAKLVACPQHLQEVKGIGSVFEQRLYAAGVGTFWELAHMKDDEMTRVLELNERQKLRMDLDAIRKDAARLAKETDSVGRIWEGKEPDNFEPLEGIGRVYEKKLYDAGICTFAALADTSIEELMRICPPSKIRKPDYEEWIAQARKLARKAKG
jgi:predicted flap endonuclease-1-like 5' DNA nuclease/peptidoglycan hydrolase CwlO-like protein